MALINKIEIIPRRKITDNRGWFLKALTGKELFLPNHTGEIYITYANPLEMKGGHFHPKAKEWFTLLQGDCVLKLIDIETKEKIEIDLSAQEPKTIFVPNNVAHAFFNKSNQNDFMLLAYSDELYDPADTILYNFID